jgi:hypothetical protein
MIYILVQHRVGDYKKWRAVYDEHGTTRQSASSESGLVLSDADDQNQITVLLEGDTLDNARALASSDDLRKTMERAGVIGPAS